jgi:hypothetical protein
VNWLVVALGALTIASWASTFLLVRAAWQRPRIGALTERAVISVILSAFGTVCVFLVINTDSGATFLTLDVARAVFRLCLLAFLLVPVLWLGLYLRNGLG